MKKAKTKKFFLALVIGLLLCGCASKIKVEKVSPAERLDYYGNIKLDGKLSPHSTNLLNNFALMDDFLNDPDNFVRSMEELFDYEPNINYLYTLAEGTFNIAIRTDESEKAMQYYLATLIYCYEYLFNEDNPKETPYNFDRAKIIQIYNASLGELYQYLKDNDLENNSDFSIAVAGGKRIKIMPTQTYMTVNKDKFEYFELCANYRPENLTHIGISSGVGVPLIGKLKQNIADSQFASEQALPATLVIEFSNSSENRYLYNAQMKILDSRNNDFAIIDNKKIPLKQDFSTPLAYTVESPLPFDELFYMLFPEDTEKIQGLYHFEPICDNRIPVVFVHGLLSSSRTWVQMLNTLQSDPVLRKHYQFWGFSYSSGLPILASAKALRDALQNERKKFVDNNKSTEMFDQMVVVGHSMGGLISKTLIMDSKDGFEEAFIDKYKTNIYEHLSKSQKETINALFSFTPQEYVKRVIFIAVPHRGSLLSRSFVGRIGASLIRLPRKLVNNSSMLFNIMSEDNNTYVPNKIATGIDNLDPKNPVLNALEKNKFSPNVKFHSVIGNNKDAALLKGSDGVVPYESSHLDGANSELIVKSNHSVQQSPLAIQEIRRILLEHIKEKNNNSIKENNKFKLIN